MDAAKLAQSILDASAKSTSRDLQADLFDAVLRYARLRAEWAVSPLERRVEMDAARFRAHNVLIDAFNILSRAMARAGEDNNWRQVLGTERRVIGDVACHMHCLLALSAR